MKSPFSPTKFAVPTLLLLVCMAPACGALKQGPPQPTGTLAESAPQQGAPTPEERWEPEARPATPAPAAEHLSDQAAPSVSESKAEGLNTEKMRVSVGSAPRGDGKARAPARLAAPALGIAAGAGRLPLTGDGGPQAHIHNTESYAHVETNRFTQVATQPLSTFSIDVDTASYSNVRRLLREGSPVPEGAVRIEELVNYFSYDYPEPAENRPFSVTTEIANAPWKPEHQLVHIGLQGKRLAPKSLPARNLVFLVDVSGSMQDRNKLPLLKRSLSALVDTLESRDHVSLVVYAGSSGLVLPPTPGSDKPAILDALRRLEAGGSTNGAGGITLAYEVARKHLDPKGVNRVVLATDGDFNVGVSSESELVKLIERERRSGVMLTVLGFGMGNYKDSTLERLAQHGNGNYAYIDDFAEARKVLIEEAGGTLVTIANDVKVQVEFNPRLVGAYRLIGYENRKLAAEDFNDDRKDAGEMGAGHSVTALYEIVPPAAAAKLTQVDALRYQTPNASGAPEDELLTVKLRYKAPGENTSKRFDVPVRSGVANADRRTATSENFRFSAAVAAFGMLLRDDPERGSSSYELVRQLAEGALDHDPHGHRRGFLTLVDQARRQASVPVARDPVSAR